MFKSIAGLDAPLRRFAAAAALASLATGAAACADADADGGPSLDGAAQALCPADGCPEPPEPPPKPDLTAVLLNAESGEACVTTWFHIEVQNIGTAFATNSVARVFSDDVLTATISVPSLAEGESYDFWVQYTPNHSTGDDYVSVEVDATKKVKESNETNNRIGRHCLG